MLSFRTCQAGVLGLILVATPAFATRTHRAATSGHSHKVRRHAHLVKGQRGIDPERATQIQNALIQQHYLAGPASGEWDATTEAAMQKYQADHGWQTKLTPDSRALINLGLGPKGDAPQSIAGGPAAPAANPVQPSPAPDANSAMAGTLADTHSIQN